MTMDASVCTLTPAERSEDRAPLGHRDPAMAGIMRRVLPQTQEEGPARVAVAAFQSSV